MPSHLTESHALENDVLTNASALTLAEEPKVERKMTITPWKKSSINIVLIGETGVGKTAMLNLLANVLAGVKLEEFDYEHTKTNEQGGSSSGSQTNKPEVYRIICADGHVVNILDTPGLADTRGMEMDQIHKEAIANAIKDKVEVIDGVIILANGTLARLGAATEYALTVISGMFPHSIVDNIGFVFTMVADPTNFNFERSSLPKELQKASLWSLNNPFAQWMKYQEKLKADPPTDEEILEDMLESVERSYKKTLKILGDKLFQWLDARTVQPTSAIYSLYLMSIEIEASISNVIARIDQTEELRGALGTLKDELGRAKDAREANKDYERIINQPFYEHENTGDEHNTLCVEGGCYSNCHINCAVGFTMDKETLGANCEAFLGTSGSGRTRVCNVCKHLAEGHQHYRSKWGKKVKRYRQVDEEAKKRYEKATTDAERKTLQQEAMEKDIKAIDEDIEELEKELSELCDKYNNLALSGTFVGYISSAIRLLRLREEKMKKEGATPEALGRMAMRIKQLEKKKKVVEDAEKKKTKVQNFSFRGVFSSFVSVYV